jgi:hypothetical protein
LASALGFRERIGTAIAKVTSACANQDIGGNAMTGDWMQPTVNNTF